MIGSFVSLIAMVLLGVGTGAFLPLALLVVLLAAILVTSVYGWTLERVAYRPLRGSFRLAALITALGASIFLQNFVQVSQGAKIKPIQPVIQGGFTFFENGSMIVSFSYLQIFIIIITIILLSIFSYIISKTPLGRSQRACEQDLTMSKLLGINVDRTISITFIIGASLASVAGMMFVLYYGVIDFFIGFLTGIKAFTAAVLGGIGSIPGAVIGGLLIGLIETFWSAYFTIEYKDVAVFGILVIVLIFRPYGILGKPEVEKV
jgi:branched-chain amino acid transport system permease protein